jgi:hypothetical protein
LGPTVLYAATFNYFAGELPRIAWRPLSAMRKGFVEHLAELLDIRRRGASAYCERWIVAFANILFRKGILTPTDFALQMAEVEARWNASPADGGTGRARP